METYTYYLKFKELHAIIDLIDYESDITRAVNCVIPNIPVEVTRYEYSFATDVEVTQSDVQKIGEIIAATSTLGQFITNYEKKNGIKYSGQLFVRKN